MTQFSMNLRPSRNWPTRLQAVGKASHHGTFESVKAIRNQATSGQSAMPASRQAMRPRRVSHSARKAPPSARLPRSHCSQPQSASTANSNCSAACPYTPLRQNSAKYSSDAMAASGQPQWISRTLQATMAMERNTATSSTQATFEPQRTNAVAKKASAMPYLAGITFT